MPDYSQPIRGVAFVFYLELISNATGGIQNNATIVAGDFKTAKDDAALVNLATLPTANGKRVKVTLSASEMDADNLIIEASDPDGEWGDYFRLIQPAGAGHAAWQRASDTIVRGTVAAGATTTSIPTSSLDPALTDADQVKGRILIFDRNTATTGLRGQATEITALSLAGILTVTALTRAPASGDTFAIV